MAVSEPLFEGARFKICAWIDEEEVSATHDFIVSLKQSNNPDAARFVHLLQQTADHGPPHNEEKFRHLHGKGEGLVEFKARGGSRILAFIDPDRRTIVCTHGVPKLKEKRFNREMDKAQEVRKLYFKQNPPGESGDIIEVNDHVN
jgi:Gp49-like protein DUF891